MAMMVRPEPFTREVDRLFDAFFGQAERTGRRWVPPMDLVEAGDHFVLKADLPGLRDEDVSLEVQDGTLTISASARPSMRPARAAGTGLSGRSAPSAAR
jgi:HSP20 family protein